ncbi:uncharacterized protein LOC133711068 [Rosa rugosa]|uniref:uncharacterized protein LOC133711068 n=1 Tax=Rosa rugosa TaxID=74645 RepID=UPI002B416241|nr:uncharacterized protein LOC133711068 [Rosa rugosa]
MEILRVDEKFGTKPSSQSEGVVHWLHTGLSHSAGRAGKPIVKWIQKFPAASKTQLRNKVREMSDFVDTHWQICWSNVITEHSQAILNSLYSFYWNLTRNWELSWINMWLGA